MSSEKTVNSPAEMLAAMGGKVRDPWEEEEDRGLEEKDETETGSRFRSKEENDRAKEIAQGTFPRISRHDHRIVGRAVWKDQCPPLHEREGETVDTIGDADRVLAEKIQNELEDLWMQIKRHSCYTSPPDTLAPIPQIEKTTTNYEIEGFADGEIAIAGHEIEGFADGGIEYHHPRSPAIPTYAEADVAAPWKRETTDPEGDDQDRKSAFYKEPDPDVMGYLHSVFDTAPQFLDGLYAVDRDSFRVEFDHSVHDLKSWFVEVNTENRYTCDEIHGDLADAVDHAKDEIRSVLAADLERLR